MIQCRIQTCSAHITLSDTAPFSSVCIAFMPVQCWSCIFPASHHYINAQVHMALSVYYYYQMLSVLVHSSSAANPHVCKPQICLGVHGCVALTAACNLALD